MPIQEKSADRERIATVVATAAITVAIGVTVAALGGYLNPNHGGGAPTEGQAATAATVEATRIGQPVASSVVLVPVAPDTPREPMATAPTPDQAQMRVAACQHDESTDLDDHDRGREHREHEDDHDEE